MSELKLLVNEVVSMFWLTATSAHFEKNNLLLSILVLRYFIFSVFDIIV